MTRRTIFNVSIALAILAGGCAYNQFKAQDGSVRAALPRPPLPETTLANVKLNSGRKVQNALGMAGRAKQIFNSLLERTEGQGAGQALSTATVGDLKAKGLFTNTILSDDSVVLFIDAKGGFVQRELIDGQQRAFNYTRLVAMFDPADGELLSYGLVP